VRIGDDGKVVKGDASKLDNWRQYGADVLAVADGTIVATQNDLSVVNFPERAKTEGAGR